MTATPGGPAGNAFGIGDPATQMQSGLTLTVTSAGGVSPEPIGVPGIGLYGDGDDMPRGLGVRGSGSWLINGNTAEQLILSFDQDVTLCSIDLNLISGPPNGGNDGAQISFDTFAFSVVGDGVGGGTVTGTAPAGTSFSGNVTDVVSFATAPTLAAGQTITLEGFDVGAGSFSLRGLTVSAVPEPSAFGLLLVAALGLFAKRKVK